jgi:hypothetical protein
MEFHTMGGGMSFMNIWIAFRPPQTVSGSPVQCTLQLSKPMLVLEGLIVLAQSIAW